MMLEVLAISFALAFGLAVRAVSIPPLVGYLIAGFALQAVGPQLGLPDKAGPVLDHVAHLGVLLLLFTVGLKLKFRQLVKPEVIGTSLIHFAITAAAFTGGIALFMGVGAETALLLGIALSFSSTVLAAKVLESKRELKSFHGRTAIGILIVQDLVAIAALAIFGDQQPTLWAFALLLLPVARPVLYWLLDVAGHEELLVLAGMLMALVLGGMAFQAVGLSGELGALIMGILLGNHSRAQEVANSLWALKEVFLVGFFLQIGLHGLPGLEEIAFAAAVGVVLPLKNVLFFFLLLAFGMRARNALLTGTTLTCYSEFGLIVAAEVLPEYVVPLAIAVAGSFVGAAAVNRYAHALVERYEGRLQRFETKREHPDEQPVELGDANILVLGMGRVGTAVYDYLTKRGFHVVGVDSDPNKIERHKAAGRNVSYADAEDSFFWHTCEIKGLKAIVLAMQGGEGKAIAARQARACGFPGLVVSHALFDDEAKEIERAGADHTYLTMAQAGVGVGEQVCNELQVPPPPQAAE